MTDDIKTRVEWLEEQVKIQDNLIQALVEEIGKEDRNNEIRLRAIEKYIEMQRP